MLKKILTAASAVVLFIMQVLPVAAANDFPLSKSNSYTVTTTGGGRTSIQYLSRQTMR